MSQSIALKKKSPILLGILWSLFSACLFAGSTTSAEKIQIGAYSTSNWRSDDFQGTASRGWDASGKTFDFIWNTENGDQIGRIGASYGSSLPGVKMGDLRPGCVLSTEATCTATKANRFYWSVYGWTHPAYTSWADTPSGWNNEFYIIMYTEKTREAFLADKGCVDIGSVNVDGEVFDCYHLPRPSQSQWLAVRRSKAGTGNVTGLAGSHILLWEYAPSTPLPVAHTLS